MFKVVETNHDIDVKIKNLCLQQKNWIIKQTDFDLYIPPNGARTLKGLEVFDLGGALHEFVNSSKRVLLVQGEFGGGKRLLGYAFIEQCLNNFKAGERIPLFITLNTLKQPLNGLLLETFQNHGFSESEIKMLQTTQKFVLFLEGYHKLNKTDNLYNTNQLGDWDVKVIFSCRTDYAMSIDNYRKCFMPYVGGQPRPLDFEEIYLTPFVPEQIACYVTQYLTVKKSVLEQKKLKNPNFHQGWLQPPNYLQWIKELEHWVEAPMMLKVLMEALPDIVAETDNATVKKRLCQAFVHHWYAKQEDEYIAAGFPVQKNFQKNHIAFAEKLAKTMHQKNLTHICYEETAADALFKTNNYHKNEWAPFLSSKLLPEDGNSEERRLARIRARQAMPLRQTQNQWTFLHRGWFYYFAGVDYVPEVSSLPQNPLGEFVSLPRITRAMAERLFKEEGIKITFEPNQTEKDVILGQGQFGRFYVGRGKERFVGIKEITGTEAILQSKIEADIQRQLNGLPNLLPIWHSADAILNQTPVLYQCMPLMGFGNGEHLREALKTTILKEKILIHVAKSLLTGLKQMHGRRIYHLDLKPANFMLDSQGKVYIIDFGCAVRKYDNSRHALLSESNGDAGYYSPQRFAFLRHCIQQPTSPATEATPCFDAILEDTWAIGVTLLELQLGEYPFPKPTTIEEYLNHWDTAYFKTLLRSCPILQQAPANSLASLISALLNLDARMTPTDALKLPLFQNEAYSLSGPALESAFRLLIDQKEAHEAEFINATASKPERPSSPSAEAYYEQGQTCERQKNFLQAFECYQKSANKGYFKAKTNVGNFYLQANPAIKDIIPQDKPKALEYFLQAANEGHIRGMQNAAMMLEYGDGVPKDVPKALFWYEKIVEQEPNNTDAAQRCEKLKARLNIKPK